MAGTKKKDERFLYMEQDEVSKLLKEAYNYHPIQGLLWDLVFNGGLRISEALYITPSHVDFKNNKIKIYTLKQKNHILKADEILFPARTITICYKIIQAYKIKPNSSLFNITRQWAWKTFKLLLKRSGLSNKYSPHALRHAHGILVAEATKGDIVKIARRLRHRNSANAFRYTHLTDNIQREVVDYLEKIRK